MTQYNEALLRKIEQRRNGKQREEAMLKGIRPSRIYEDEIQVDQVFVKVFRKYEKEWRQKNRLASKAEC